MHNIRDFVTFELLFRLSPATYKAFWKRKFCATGQKLSADTFSKHAYLEKEIALLPQLFKHTETFIDVGANLGAYLFWAELFHVQRIVAFEPVPYLFKKLKRIFPAMSIEPYALSNAEQKLNIYVPIQNQREKHTRATLHMPKSSSFTSFQIQATTLDSYCQQNNLQPDFIKIDVEGHELQVLEGATSTINKYKPLCLIEIEKQQNPNYEIVLNILHAMEYCAFYVDSMFTLRYFSNIDQLQKPEHAGTPYYTHNFLFIHKTRVVLLEPIIDKPLIV